MDIGQPEIPALMPTNQTFVVKSQKAQHRRLQIVDDQRDLQQVQSAEIGHTALFDLDSDSDSDSDL